MKSFYYCIALTFIFSFHNLSHGQDSLYTKTVSLNQLDSLQRKQGHWQLHNPHVGTTLHCEFINDTVVGNINIRKNNKLILTLTKPNGPVRSFIAYYEKDTLQGQFTIIDSKLTVTNQKEEVYSDPIATWLHIHSSFPPQYPTGEVGIQQHITKFANNYNTQGAFGKVMVQFVIDQKGYAQATGFATKAAPELNNEAMRIVNAMPRWRPGFQRGRFVKTKFTLPVIFR